MLFLTDDVEWTPIIMGRVFTSLGIPSDSRELVPPPQSCILFILWPHSTLWLIHNRAGKTKYDQVERPKLACQRHKTIVKHMFNPCQVFGQPCMYLQNNCHSLWCD